MISTFNPNASPEDIANAKEILGKIKAVVDTNPEALRAAVDGQDEEALAKLLDIGSPQSQQTT